MEREALGHLGIFAGELAPFPTEVQRRVVAELEELGYGAIWYGEAFARETFVQGAIFLSATRRMIVASGIANIYARDAAAMTFGGRSLNELGEGRFVLGLGVAHASNVTVRGHDYGRPVATMRAYLDAMDAADPLWRGPESTPPPRVLAALRPRMLALAADRTAGAHPYFVPVEHTRRARAALGPDRLLAPEQAAVLAGSREAARAIGDRHTSFYLRAPNYRNSLIELGWAEAELEPPGSDALFDALVAWGGVEEVRQRVREHREAGADHVVLNLITKDPSKPYLEEARLLAGV
ncbi:MAG TPA: TIGR03620 family F420-dependent LLM class oxidoreductase [Candidatus Dormibacteraeota bacterium]